MALNFNNAPYYDDFSPDDNYHRILFQPGYAVQARELTQSQTILQNQITQFASAIYSQNTPISGGKVTTNLNCNYVKLNPTYNGTTISIDSLVGDLVTDQYGIITATILAAQSNLDTGLSPTLVISYKSGQQFSDGMTLFIGGVGFASSIGISGGETSIGISSTASISAGVFYIINGYNRIIKNGVATNYNIGNFVNVLPQTIVLDAYDNTPSMRVGLNIVENIVNSSTDSALLDPAVGASNFQAPGADRYQIVLNLETRQLTAGDDDQFIELVRLESGSVVKQTDQTVYSAIDDYFAKRDFETNGDYVVDDFKLTAGTQGGHETLGNPDQYNLYIGPGVAYVRGYRIENQSTQTITSDRARATASVISDTTYFDYGNYFVVDTLKGVFDYTTMPSVDLHCVPAANINSSNVNTYNSTLVGNALIRNLDYQYSTGSTTNTYVFNAHVADVNTTTLSGTISGTGNTSTTVIFTDTTGKFSSAANAYFGATLSITGGTDNGDVTTVVSYNGATKTATVYPPFNITPDATSTFNIVFAQSNINSIVQANPSTYALTANANINLNGKTNGVYSGSTILQGTTTPELIFPLGMSYVANVSSSNYYTTQIFRNVGFDSSNTITLNATTPLHFQGTVGQTYYGEGFKQLFTVIDTTTGNILDFSTSGNTATITSSSTVKITSNTYSSKTSGIDVFASMFASSADGNTVLKYKSLTVGNTTYAGTFTNPNSVANTKFTLDVSGNPTGQVLIAKAAVNTTKTSLYVADVKSVSKIYDTLVAGSTPSGALTKYKDITTSFALNDGQSDSHYHHSYVKLLPGVSKPTGDILVVFDYYLHTGGDGYFNINSYLKSPLPETSIASIPSYLATDGVTYNLGDCIDFRPSRKNAANSVSGVWEYTASTNSNGVDIHGILMPQNLSNYQCNYDYYLGRKDKLVLTKDGTFSIIEGAPAINPGLPTEPTGSLVLANISLDPYTAYVQGENPTFMSGENGLGIQIHTTPSNLSIDKIPHKRWAKSDITGLQTQVDNLEYYTSLSLLEQQAQALQVPDVNGLNRFKNGILVDSFSDFGAADTSNIDYAANINIRKRQLSPVTEVCNYHLQNTGVMASLGTASNTNTYAVSSICGGSTNIFTLPYSKKILINQPYATSNISVNPFNVTLYQGVMSINPPLDNWVNNVETPSITISTPNLQIAQYAGGLNLTNAGDFASLPGTTNITNPSQGTVEQSYINQLNGLNKAESSSASAQGLSVSNGYVTNTAVAPFIRAQELIIRAKGMLHNTPLSCWFDGTNVDKWVTSPNIIMLTGVVGTFYDDNIVGFYESNVNTFYPIGRVVSVTVTSATTVSLYIATTINPPSTVSTTTLINAYFDTNGNYLPNGHTGSGTIVYQNGSLQSLHNSGSVTGLGGGWTSALSSIPSFIFKSPIVTTYCSFLNTYGVWGDQAYGSTSYSASFPFNITVAGTYLITASCDNSATVLVDGANSLSVPGFSTTYTKSVSLSIGSHTISWTATNTGGPSAIGITITDTAGLMGLPNNLVWDTVTPSGLTYAAAGTETKMPGGGSYFEGATKIQLDKNANGSSNTAYVGCTITFKTVGIYGYNFGATYVPPKPVFSGDGDGPNISRYWAAVSNWNTTYTKAVNAENAIQYNSSTTEFVATITAYDHISRTVTVDPPVNISLGYNSNAVGDISSQYTMSGTQLSVANAIQSGDTIAQLSTDENGTFVGIFNMPGSNFFTGQRVFRADNRTYPSLPSTATTYAEAVFTASNISQSNQLSASVDSSSIPVISVAQKTSAIINANPSPLDALAQTFQVSKENYPNGVFISSVKLFFQSKDTSAPIKVSIVGTLNGNPNGQTLPYSTVSLAPSQVQTSIAPHYLDSTTWTEFVFSAPVYIQSGVLYAIMVSSSSANYITYFAEQGKLINPLSTSPVLPLSQGGVLPSASPKIGATPYVGSLFESQNSITWTPDQTKDLMFTINQCVFDTTKTPVLDFVIPKNLPVRKLGTNDILYGIDPNIVSNLYAKFWPNSPVHALNFSTTDFTPSSSKINYQYSTTLTNTLGVTPPTNVAPGGFAAPTQDNIHLNDGLGERILVSNSTNSLQLFATLSSTDSNISPVISDDGLTAYTIKYYINNMGIDTNKIAIVSGGTGYNANSMSVTISSPDVGGDNAVLGFTTNTSTGIVNSVYVTYPGSGYLTTPTITITDPLTRSGNANASITVYGETSPVGGNGYAKYITKPVILTPGNDSGDLRVYYTAYKPVGTEVLVYYKILNAADTSKFTDQNWQLMTQVSNANVYSTDRSNLVEFEWAPGSYSSHKANNTISYTSTNGQTYNQFIQFAIKVVLVTNDRTNVPFLTDIRALALPSGTGI